MAGTFRPGYVYRYASIFHTLCDVWNYPVFWNGAGYGVYD